MAQYRNKPVVIEAEQFLYDKPHPMFGDGKPTQIPDGVIKKKIYDYQDPAPYYKWGVETLDGFMECTDKDWIITGSKGEKYICKPDIFENTYQPDMAIMSPQTAYANGYVVGINKQASHAWADQLYKSLRRLVNAVNTNPPLILPELKHAQNTLTEYYNYKHGT